MKKKVVISLLILMGLHAITWWLWGTNRLLVKGYSYLENNQMCNNQFNMMNSSYTFSDSVIDLKADKFWLSSVSNIDSVIELSLGDSSIKVYAQNSKKWDGLLEEMYSTNIGKQVLISDYYSERTNPYFQRGHYACWGLGSDDYLDHDPILVWAYFGWIEVFSWDDLMRFKYRFVDPKPGPSPENECFFC